MDEAVDPADVRDIETARAGDAEGFRGLVERHGPRVYDLARRLTRDAQLAEDMSQQAFANAWRALSRFDLARPFRHWILRITTNLCRNLHASRSLRREVSGAAGEDDPALDPPAPSAPEAPLAAPAHVRAAIEALPERYRLAVVLHHLHGLSLEAIAEIADQPVATIKTHLFRGRQALRALLFPPETSGPPGGTPTRKAP